MEGFQRAVASNPEVDFLEALAVNVTSANVDLILPNRMPYWFINAIAIIATENKDYELQFFSKTTNNTGALATEAFVGMYQFTARVVGPPATAGYPQTVDTLTKYFASGLNIPYVDQDQLANANGGEANARLHVRLINRSAVAKSAGAPGALQVIVYVANQGLQPT